MPGKDCGHHQEERNQLYRHIIAAIVALIILILFVIFLVWVILRPTKPHFMLQDTTVYVFNLSSTTSPTSPSPNTLTTNMQVTISSRNPNDRIGIYYQKLELYASYRSQQITLATLLPTTYQGHKDVTVWSPFLYGNAVPVSQFVLNALEQDQNAGALLVNVKINGRVKWKVGTWVSGKYHIHVNCPAYIRFSGDQNNGIGIAGPAVKFQILQGCSVDV